MASPSDNTCPVCLAELRRGVRGELGKPENCNHLFCFTCIHEWAKNVNNCPVDRIPFNQIEVLSSRNRKLIRKVYVADHTLDRVEDSDSVTYCEICHECSREESLLLCDGCDRGYHLECLRPSLHAIPEGNWYCSHCETIIRSQRTDVFSSGEEDSMSLNASAEWIPVYSGYEEDVSTSQSEGSLFDFSSDDNSSADELATFQPRFSSRNAPHRMVLETDSEEDSSDSTSDGIVHPGRVRALRQCGLDSSVSFSSVEDDEAGSNFVLESDHEPDLTLGDQSEQVSDGPSIIPRSTLRKKRVLDSDSDSDEDDCDVLVRQPSAKKHCSLRCLSSPGALLQKVEEMCSSEYGRPELSDCASEYNSTLESGNAVTDNTRRRGSKNSRRLFADEDNASDSVAERKSKRQFPPKNLLPDSDLEISEGERSTSPDVCLHGNTTRTSNGRGTKRVGKGKGKEPASASRRVKKKALSQEVPQPEVSSSSDSDALSLHSGYCSPYQSTCSFIGKESCKTSWLPNENVEVTPKDSPWVTRQGRIQNATTRQSESKIRVDDAPAERRLLRSTKSTVQTEALPDDFEEKVLGGGRSKRSNTKKVTKRKQRSRRGTRRTTVKSGQGSSSRRNRSAMRNRARRKRSALQTHAKRRRTKKASKRKGKAAKTKHVSNADSPGTSRSALTPRSGQSRECVQIRSRARTAATHSPRDPTFRAAVIEAYRHENTSAGLQQAQALLQQRRESLQNSLLRYQTAAAIYGHTPTSGYNIPFGQETSTNERRGSRGSTKISSTPLSRTHEPAGDGLHYGNDEIKRRTISRRKLSSVALSYPRLPPAQQEGGSVSRKTSTRESTSGDLLGKICKSLNDLQQKSNVIKRDGSIIPINIDSSSDCELTPTKEPSPPNRHGNSNIDVTSVSKGGHSKALPKSWGSNIHYNNVPTDTSHYTSSDRNCTAGARSTHTQARRLESHSQDHDHRHAHDDLRIKSAFSNHVQQDDTRQDNANPSNNAPSKTLVKEIVKGYYKAGMITNREYWRILEKATEKVQSGRQPANEGRVKRLIADYVEGYKSSRSALAL